MPRLTELQVRSAKAKDKGYRITDEGGLFLFVAPTGSKIWRVRIRKDGRDTAISLGEYPAISLREAREARDEIRKRVISGQDPRREKKQSPTLKEVAADWIDAHRAVWRQSYIESIMQRLGTNVFPSLGNIPIAQIEAKQILNTMRIVEARGALESARKTLSMLGQIMRYAVSAQLIPSDPTRDLHGALKKRQQGHFAAATTKEEASTIVRAVRNCNSALIVRLALDFLMLTFVRPGNVRNARWEDFDLPNKIWRIPAEQMKMNRDHDVPLSRQALAVLEQAALISGGKDGLVFPSLRNRGKPLSDAVFVVALRSAGIPPSLSCAHGFRSMASTLLNEAGVHPDLIEKQLAHISGDRIRAIYNRAEYLAKRREMMQLWADMLDELGQ